MKLEITSFIHLSLTVTTAKMRYPENKGDILYFPTKTSFRAPMLFSVHHYLVCMFENLNAQGRAWCGLYVMQSPHIVYHLPTKDGYVAATMFIIFWDILIDEQVLFSLQVKSTVIISNKHGIYELPNNLRLWKLANITKILKINRIIA